MYPISHFLFPLFISEILVQFGIITHELALLTGVLAVLIDFDHLIAYIIYYHSFSIKKAWNGATVKKDERERTFIHHQIGFILITIIIILLFFINKTASLIVLIAYYSHMLLDYVDVDKIFITKKILRIKEEGFIIKIPLSEIIFDLLLLASIILLFIY